MAAFISDLHDYCPCFRRIKKRRRDPGVGVAPLLCVSLMVLGVANFVYNGLEGCGIVECEVGEDFAVDFDAGLVDEAHELGVAEAFDACGGVDTLDPQCAEVAFLLLTVAVSVGQTFFPGVFGDGPDVAAAAKVAACKFQDFFTASTRCYVVY